MSEANLASRPQPEIDHPGYLFGNNPAEFLQDLANLDGYTFIMRAIESDAFGPTMLDNSVSGNIRWCLWSSILHYAARLSPGDLLPPGIDSLFSAEGSFYFDSVYPRGLGRQLDVLLERVWRVETLIRDLSYTRLRKHRWNNVKAEFLAIRDSAGSLAESFARMRSVPCTTNPNKLEGDRCSALSGALSLLANFVFTADPITTWPHSWDYLHRFHSLGVEPINGPEAVIRNLSHVDDVIMRVFHICDLLPATDAVFRAHKAASALHRVIFLQIFGMRDDYLDGAHDEVIARATRVQETVRKTCSELVIESAETFRLTVNDECDLEDELDEDVEPDVVVLEDQQPIAPKYTHAGRDSAGPIFIDHADAAAEVPGVTSREMSAIEAAEHAAEELDEIQRAALEFIKSSPHPVTAGEIVKHLQDAKGYITSSLTIRRWCQPKYAYTKGAFGCLYRAGIRGNHQGYIWDPDW